MRKSKKFLNRFILLRICPMSILQVAALLGIEPESMMKAFCKPKIKVFISFRKIRK